MKIKTHFRANAFLTIQREEAQPIITAPQEEIKAYGWYEPRPSGFGHQVKVPH
jgi:hypothetical protein